MFNLITNLSLTFIFTAPSGQPSKPTLTISPSSASTGTQITMTCASPDAGISSYSFYRNGALFQQQTQSVLNFPMSEARAGDFTCQTTINNINSDFSEASTLSVPGEVLSF